MASYMGFLAAMACVIVVASAAEVCMEGQQLPLPDETGTYTPVCTKKGYFEVKQSANGKSWCVNPRNGIAVPNSQVEGDAACSGCVAALGAALTKPAVGFYIPQCEVDGTYKKYQYHSHFVWCVDASGKEVPNSKQSIVGGMPVC